MLILQNISYIHPNRELLFNNLNLTINKHQKIALIGNNGVGKSTLLKIISGKLQITKGQFTLDASVYYVPQIFGQFNHLTITQALGIDDKINALHQILNGEVTNNNLTLLNDDWDIEERCAEALKHWDLADLDITQSMKTLSGGQKTKVFLAGISIHRPDLIVLDEPSNHLDIKARQILYDLIQTTTKSLLVVSHDRKLLNLLNTTYELNQGGIKVYGGNYDFYAEQKSIENNALVSDINSKEKALKKAKEKERETQERQQKLNVRGKNKQEKAGIATIMLNTLKNKAERSTAKIKGIHAEKIDGISQELQQLRKGIPAADKMKFDFEDSTLHGGKTIFSANDINFSFTDKLLWQENLSFQISASQRINLKGLNGSGKSTLIKIILGSLEPQVGTVYRAFKKAIYIDQDYSLIDNNLKVYEQAQQFNSSALQEHEIKIKLNRFLFSKDDWDKPCGKLSGGEKMRLMLCCLTVSNQSPDIIILDEPTNNLDIQNIEILTNAIIDYTGTLIVVSHDAYFLEEINTQHIINL